jgi:putative transcriptional regulator
MALQFKINVISALKDKGFTTYTLRKEQLLSESTIQKLRSGKGVSWENIETLCRLLECQPGDLMEYVKDTGEGVQ